MNLYTLICTCKICFHLQITVYEFLCMNSYIQHHIKNEFTYKLHVKQLELGLIWDFGMRLWDEITWDQSHLATHHPRIFRDQYVRSSYALSRSVHTPREIFSYLAGTKNPTTTESNTSWCDARLGGSKSNAVNLILRLFLYHFLHTMSLWRHKSIHNNTNNQQTPPPWWWSCLPLQQHGFDESTTSEWWAALRIYFPRPLLKGLVQFNKLM